MSVKQRGVCPCIAGLCSEFWQNAARAKAAKTDDLARRWGTPRQDLS